MPSTGPCAVLLLLLVSRQTPAGAPLRLSLAEAERLAAGRSPILQQANARLSAAEARMRGAGAQPNPALAVGQPFGSNTGGLDEDILLTQTLEIGGKRTQRIRMFTAERDAAIAERASNLVDVAAAVETAYYNAQLGDEERRVAADALATAQEFARTAQIQFEAGDVPRSQVVRSQVEVSRATQALAAADTDRANRYAALRSEAGIPASAELVLTDALAFRPVSVTLDAATRAAIQRPDVRAARQLLAARSAAARGARAESEPDLFVEARHEKIDPTVGGSSLRVGFAVPVFDWGRTHSDVRAAQATVQEQAGAVIAAERAARLDAETSWRNMDEARKAVESFTSGRLQRSRELLDMAQTGYAHGANTYLELLDTQQVYRSEQADYARALAAWNVAVAALRKAVGGTLPP